MANKKTNKTPANTKPKKPSWIRACFGFGSSHIARAVAGQPSIDEVPAGGGARKRKLGLGILRVVKKPWCKKKVKTTSLKNREKVVGGSTGSCKAAVVANQKSLLLLLDDDESHETQGPFGTHIQEKFDVAKDTSRTICQNQSKPIKEDASGPHKTKVNKPGSEERAKHKEEPSSDRVLAKQSRGKNTKRSNNKDAFVGMLVLVTILTIMLLCGRLCAILCTSIWFYCMPQFTKTTKSNKSNAEGNNSSVKSEIERRKVVFMGFLERKQNVFC